ncbi:MAG: hypothetical protein KA015_01045 [Spirochaetes bacterium]|nr:hypothetical protein [Spirochaetota bacterium]
MKKIAIMTVLVLSAIMLQAQSVPAVDVYTMPGCSRCTHVVDFLKGNNIRYNEYSTSKNENRSKMWTLLKSPKSGFSGGSVTMPVVEFNGKLYFNIPNLSEFEASILAASKGGKTDIKTNDDKPDTGSKISQAFRDNVLLRHNFYRKKHSAPDLQWSNEIEKYAQQWADKLASENKMYHRQPNKYGENIYWISGGDSNGQDAVDAWYSEIKQYNFNKPGFSMATGHFTQLVWKGSTLIGCGKAKSKNGGIYVVCNYSAPGNYSGKFKENVLPAGGGNVTPSEPVKKDLPTQINIYVSSKGISNQFFSGSTKKILPIANNYKESDGVYIAVYTRKEEGAVYSIGNGIYVAGLIRVKGKWKGNIAVPEGWDGYDISASKDFSKFAAYYYPFIADNCWVGGDTGGIFK